MASNPVLPKRSKATISYPERWRKRTNYERNTGYAAVSFAAVVEIGRLTSGKATQIMYVLWAAAAGDNNGGKIEYQEQAPDISTAELAAVSYCDERTIQRELADLARRGVIEWEQPKKGVNRIRLLFRSWASLPDYKPGPVAEPEPDETPDETAEEQKAKQASETIVTKRPVYVAAGKASKAVRLDCGVEAIQLKAGDIDASWSAVVQSGVLVVSLTQKWEPQKGVSGLLKKQAVTGKDATRVSHVFQNAQGRTTGESSSRDARNASASQISGGATWKHPRAKELCSLFDDVLLRSCRKTLSGDLASLQQSCEAIGQVPHNDLVKAVVERAKSPIKNPRHCVLLCREIAHNWEASLKHSKKQAARIVMCSHCGKEAANIGEHCYSCYGVLSA